MFIETFCAYTFRRSIGAQCVVGFVSLLPELDWFISTVAINILLLRSLTIGGMGGPSPGER